VYADFRVGEINTAKGEEFMELRYPGGEVYLALGQAHGEVDALAVQREMIRRTIKEHLEKEKLLRPKGIKVLSLFFIESVARYRQYDKDGNPVKGDYARIFEEEYRRAAKLPAFQSLFGEVDLAQEAAAVHDGYFSIDKKGRWADPELDKEGGLKNETSRADAERGYNLIMKEKEKLLTFSTPLKFIFSHSALKEGWDNPNVFQICALREMGSERERRQTLGRGLRLCVNQDGQRLRPRREPADGDRDRVVPGVRRPAAEGDRGRHRHPLRHRRATPVRHHRHHHAGRQGGPAGRGPVQGPVDHLRAAGHIDAKGKVQDSLKTALKDGKLACPRPSSRTGARWPSCCAR
jgi:type III restriction enzyme